MQSIVESRGMQFEGIEISSNTCEHIVVSNVEGVTIDDLKGILEESGGHWALDSASELCGWHLIEFKRIDSHKGQHPIFPTLRVFQVNDVADALTSPAFSLIAEEGKWLNAWDILKEL